MTEEKQGTGTITLILVLVLIILGLGGFIVYDKFIVSDDVKCSDIDKDDDYDNLISDEDDDSYSVLMISPFLGLAVNYNGEVYVNIYDQTNIDAVYGNGMSQKLVSSISNYKDYEMGNFSVTGRYSLDEYKWFKLDVSDVDSIYNNEYGQALSTTNPKYGIIMLKKDKTVSYISYKDIIEGKNTVTKLDVSNISSVVSENRMGITTYLVDSTGEKKDVNNYIK